LSERSRRLEIVAVAAMAVAVLVLHLATNARYDFHRDSLYYMDSARHPAWGYVDYPPVTPTIARLSLWLFGPSVWGLRLWPSIAGALMVVLAALIARELGGGPPARLRYCTRPSIPPDAADGGSYLGCRHSVGPY